MFRPHLMVLRKCGSRLALGQASILRGNTVALDRQNGIREGGDDKNNSLVTNLRPSRPAVGTCECVGRFTTLGTGSRNPF
jgi:hypothetical protein